MRFLILLAGLLLWQPHAHAEEVTAEVLGLDAMGNLEMAPGKPLNGGPVVLFVHDTLAHHRVEVLSAQQELLRERGIASLAITLTLGLNKRHGMFDCSIEQDHRHDDAVEEIAAWIGWLKAKGATQIVLAGHGRGGAQAALYAKKKADKIDKAVTKLVLISPLAQTFESAEADYAARGRGVLIERATQASQLAGQGDMAAMMGKVGFLGCQQAKVTAGAFADYYSSSPRLFTPNLLPAIKQPVLVIAGDADPEYAALEARHAGQDVPRPRFRDHRRRRPSFRRSFRRSVGGAHW